MFRLPAFESLWEKTTSLVSVFVFAGGLIFHSGAMVMWMGVGMAALSAVHEQYAALSQALRIGA